MSRTTTPAPLRGLPSTRSADTLEDLTMATAPECWLCASRSVKLLRPGMSPLECRSEDFRITDSHYGTTGGLYRCEDCGFRFCPELGDVLLFYEGLEDPAYEQTRHTRALQARKLMEFIRRYRPSGRLLDVGAGSGILVEQALEMGYRADGIEPSEWLCRQAATRHLPVHHGCLPDPSITGSFDVVTLVDVIEHVTDPLGLLEQSVKHLAPDGIIVIVTPDVGSVPARLLRDRWWHYRLAHVGYFDRTTLGRALTRSGLEALAWRRPTWFFPSSYLMERLGRYLPLVDRLAYFDWSRRITVPLNLRDSWMVVAQQAAKLTESSGPALSGLSSQS